MASRRRGGLHATVNSNNTHSEDSPEEESTSVKFKISFMYTPNSEDVRKKCADTKTASLSTLIASLPIDMMETISDCSKEMLGIFCKLSKRSRLG